MIAPPCTYSNMALANLYGDNPDRPWRAISPVINQIEYRWDRTQNIDTFDIIVKKYRYHDNIVCKISIQISVVSEEKYRYSDISEVSKSAIPILCSSRKSARRRRTQPVIKIIFLNGTTERLWLRVAGGKGGDLGTWVWMLSGGVTPQSHNMRHEHSIQHKKGVNGSIGIVLKSRIGTEL
ncbi:unnamed protein product [Nesidiocoris tenuis]|uniref:Uncharacterized protein n=1 Tax=Nesidiocoris tenuis TaxID=355587 RepID=A0A6H5G0T8_9HEMI|nr:unnamed protein product [Nesidiocoris tenuis]